MQFLLDTTTALCRSRDLANAFLPSQRLPERRRVDAISPKRE